MRPLHLLLLSLVLGIAGQPVWAGTLDRIRETGKIVLGYRVDTLPFSSSSADGKPEGYSIELCRKVASAIAVELKLPPLEPVFKAVDTETRFEQLAKGEVDLICSADTVTLERRRQVDFSLLTFATGATLLYREDGPQSFETLAGQNVGVRAGTTTEEALDEIVRRGALKAIIVPVQSHEDGVAKLAAKELAAYFGDGAILLFQLLKSPHRDALKLSDRMLTFEPYALPVRRDDPDFRLTVDRELARLYRSGEIGPIFSRSFGGARPSELVQAMYRLQGLPE